MPLKPGPNVECSVYVSMYNIDNVIVQMLLDLLEILNFLSF